MAEVSRVDVAQEIRERQRGWMDAWIANDRAALEEYLAPEFALIVSARAESRVDRAAWLRTAGTEYTCEEFVYDAMQVRDFGDVVTVSSIATQRATAFGQDRSGSFFLVDVWRRRDGVGPWQVIARYSSHPEPVTASAAALHSATHHKT